MTRAGIVKGNTIELDRALPYPDGQVVSVEVVPTLRRGSPTAVLGALQSGPKVTHEDVRVLQQAIAEGKLPAEVASEGV